MFISGACVTLGQSWSFEAIKFRIPGQNWFDEVFVALAGPIFLNLEAAQGAKTPLLKELLEWH